MVEILTDVFSDSRQAAAAAGASMVIDIAHDLDPRQMRWQRTLAGARFGDLCQAKSSSALFLLF